MGFWTIAIFPLSAAKGGDAVFSRDGKNVYLLCDEGGALDRVKVETGRAEKVSLAEWIGGAKVLGLARSKSGFILVATSRQVWAWDDAKGTAVIVNTVAAGTKINGIAYDPSKRRVLLTAVGVPAEEGGRAEERLLVKRAKSEKWETVRTRRVGWISGMDFTKGGDFVFCTEGDVWIGDIREDVIPQGSEDPKRAAELAKEPAWVKSILDAYRIAPLATRETAEGTPGQMGVISVAVSRRHIYAHLRRMGGSGWGRVVRFSLPETERDEDGYLDLVPDVADRARRTAAVLATVEDLGSQSRDAFLCASPDGDVVYFMTSDPEGAKHWLATGDGEPKPAAVRGLEK